MIELMSVIYQESIIISLDNTDLSFSRKITRVTRLRSNRK